MTTPLERLIRHEHSSRQRQLARQRRLRKKRAKERPATAELLIRER